MTNRRCEEILFGFVRSRLLEAVDTDGALDIPSGPWGQGGWVETPDPMSPPSSPANQEVDNRFVSDALAETLAGNGPAGEIGRPETARPSNSAN